MARQPVVLAIVDVPNVVMALRLAKRGARPQWEHYHAWLRALARQVSAPLEAWAFLNQEVGIPIFGRLKMQDNLHDAGFKTHLHQKQCLEDDVDELMVHKLYDVWDDRGLAAAVIFSHDMRNFRHEVRELEIAQIPTFIAGVPKQVGWRYATPKGARHHKVVDLRNLPSPMRLTRSLS